MSKIFMLYLIVFIRAGISGECATESWLFGALNSCACLLWRAACGRRAQCK